ncbi:MAG: amino acid adenylation domain-containing protein [Micromonosporaceae bacterium]|nr:amino acid adenylation domain-containing protein [Micromonosporaceae bacterium]
MTDLQQRLARLTPPERAALEERLLATAGSGPARIPRRPPGAGAPPLSFGQERLWFLQQFDPTDASYNLYLTERLRGPVDPDALQRAFDEVLARHEVLRTRFPMVDGRPAPVAAPVLRVPLARLGWDDLAPADREAQARRLVAQLVNEPFDLGQAPLLRVNLLRLAEQEHVLCLVMHHMAGDGWSLNVLAQDLSHCYAAALAGQPPGLPPLPLQYADFAAWQPDRVAGSDRQVEDSIERMRDRLADVPPLQLPTDLPRPQLRTARGDYLCRRLGAGLSARITELAKAERATVFMALLAAYQVLLARHSGQTDFCVGSPIAGRDRPELRPLIGFFTNTLVLRSDLAGDPSFRELLGRVRASALQAYADQEVPLERLIERLDADRDTGRTPLFQTMFNLQPARTGLFALPGVASEPWRAGFAQVKVDLELHVNQSPEELELEFGYSTALFEPSTVERMAGHLAALLTAATADPDQPISRLSMLEDTERRLVLRGWNDTAAAYPQRRLHELVAEQVARSPDATAVVAGADQLSYRELDRRANRLAWRLREIGLAPESPVGVLLPRDADLIVALLGVLKAGCCYLPLEPGHPTQRLRQLLTDSGATALIARGGTDLELPEAIPVLPVDDPPAGSDRPPPAPGTPDSLAYLIYTSGSTGRPKGVRVPHRGVVNLVTDLARRPGLTSADRFLFLTSVSFDIAGLEIFAPLLTGGTVVVAADSSVHAADRLRALIEQGGVTTVQAPPSVLEALLPGLPDGLGRVISGGEPLPARLAERLLGRVGEVWNFYGPTETTIWSCRSRVRPGAGISIGTPVANTEAYVLDEHGRPAPVGGVGELFLAGDGLARDYHDSPGLTASRFLPDPYGPRPGGRMYRTGDLVRRRSDGRLEFLGRVDDQVKIRGVRVEPGEVEAALASHPRVRRAAVAVRADAPSGPGLVGYVDWDGDPGSAGDADPAGSLRAHLRARLPEAMIPTAFEVVPEFPVLPSGKLDRAALPAPAGGDRPAPYTPPGTDSEQLVADVFAEVLGQARVGTGDDFFDLGGHSLLAVKVIAELAATTRLDIPLRTLFVHRTVAELAAAVEELLAAEIDQLSEAAAVRLAAAEPGGAP